MPGESKSDISNRLTTAKGHNKGSTNDRQRSYLDARLISGSLVTTGSVADKQRRLGLTVREYLKPGDIT